jgi:hypothetical protein
MHHAPLPRSSLRVLMGVRSSMLLCLEVSVRMPSDNLAGLALIRVSGVASILRTQGLMTTVCLITSGVATDL